MFMESINVLLKDIAFNIMIVLWFITFALPFVVTAALALFIIVASGRTALRQVERYIYRRIRISKFVIKSQARHLMGIY